MPWFLVLDGSGSRPSTEAYDLFFLHIFRVVAAAVAAPDRAAASAISCLVPSGIRLLLLYWTLCLMRETMVVGLLVEVAPAEVVCRRRVRSAVVSYPTFPTGRRGYRHQYTTVSPCCWLI